MAHVVKCTICGERFDRDAFPYVETANMRFAHAHCALDKWNKNPIGDKPEVIDPANIRLCTYCKKQINLKTDDYVQITENLFAHKECQEKEDKRPKSDREKLEIYISKLFQTDFCPPNIMRQINILEEKGYTDSGMLKTLIYFYDIKGNHFDISRKTIMIIPYIYGEAREYYKKLYYATLYNSERDIKQYIPKQEEVTISPPHRETIRKRNLFTFLDEEGEEDN